MEIRVFSTINDNEITVRINETTENHPTTIKDVLALQAVVDAFDEDPAENFIDYNDNEVPDAFREIILGQQAHDGDGYGIESECDVEADEQEEAGDGAAPQNTGADGFCTVITNGGFVHTRVAIKNGVTKLADVVYNDEVSRNSGMSRAQLSNCDITQNNEIRRADALEFAPVRDGDTIRVALRVSKDGGRR